MQYIYHISYQIIILHGLNTFIYTSLLYTFGTYPSSSPLFSSLVSFLSSLSCYKEDLFNSQHIYRLEWQPNGYIDWYLDGVFLFGIPQVSKHIYTVRSYDSSVLLNLFVCLLVCLLVCLFVCL